MTLNYVNLSGGRGGGKKQTPLKHIEREGKRQEKSMLWQSEEEEEEKKQSESQITPSSLPPSSLVETLRESALRPDYD